MTIRVTTDSEAMQGQRIFVQLRDVATGSLVEERLIDEVADGEPGATTFRFRPENSGVQFYRVAALTEADRETLEDSTSDKKISSAGEATLLNNHRVVAIDRDRGQR